MAQGHKFFDLSGDRQFDDGEFFLVGFDLYFFGNAASAVTFGIDLDRDFPLTTGRDLSRVRDSRTPSAGFNLDNLQRRIAFVLNNKSMQDFGPL